VKQFFIDDGFLEACVNYMTPWACIISWKGFHTVQDRSTIQEERIGDQHTIIVPITLDSDSIGAEGERRNSSVPSPLSEMFDDIKTCPEKYLLWFHHARWDHTMQSGRTLWEELCSKYYAEPTM